MKKKYKLFFGSMAISVFVTAVLGVFVFWQLYAGGEAQNPGDSFNTAEFRFLETVEPDPVDDYVDAASYDYEETVVLPEIIFFEPLEEVLYDLLHYEEYEYLEEEVVEPVEPRYLVALTFDDGPAAPTWQILDILEYHDARATFFVIGRRLRQWRETALRIFEEGHEIANHTYGHQILIYPLTEEEIIREIQAASAAIQAITGVRPTRMVRPPAGRIEGDLPRIAAGLGYALMLWDLDPLDWFYRDADMVYEHIMSNVEHGSIIVLHDTHASTAEAMERVVPSLIQQGFELVTVSELFERMRGRAPSAGRVYRRAQPAS